MARQKLTDRTLKALKPGAKPYDVMDSLAPGLGVRVMGTIDAPVRSFILLARFPGSKNPTRRAIGPYPAITLEAARKVAAEWRDLIKLGKDPQEEIRREADTERAKRAEEKTIEEVAHRFIQQYVMQINRLPTQVERARILGFKIEADGSLSLRQNQHGVATQWGARLVSSITGANVIDFVDGIFEAGKPIMANRTLSLLKRFFSWSVSKKYLKASPCEGAEPPGKENKRRRVLKPHELRAVWKAAERLGGPAGDAFKMLLLTGQRKSQISYAKLSDFDLKERVWTIPPESQGTKSDDAHVLPITAEIEAIVKARPYSQGYLFSTTGGEKPLTIGDKLKKKMDILVLEELRREAEERGDDPAEVKMEPWTVHDLRRTMRTGLSSLAIPEGDVVRELVIGHKQKGVHGIYDLYLYLAEKRVALELWAARVKTTVSAQNSNVVQFDVKHNY